MPISIEAPDKIVTKRLALFLDGTWNTVSDNTNVWRVRALCAPTSSDGRAQRAYYNSGLGTRFGEKIRGGMFGYGIDQTIRDAYEWLVENDNSDDEIFIFGFSRGAYTARSLAGLISKCGLLTAGAPLGVGQLYSRYRQPSGQKSIRDLFEEAEDKTHKFTLEENWMMKYSRPVRINLIGVWDTVGALGVPFPGIPGLGQSHYGFLDTNLRRDNEHAFHALAIDEHRQPRCRRSKYPPAKPGALGFEPLKAAGGSLPRSGSPSAPPDAGTPRPDADAQPEQRFPAGLANENDAIFAVPPCAA